MNFINFAYEQQKIVTDGLILNLDAGNISSYSGTGSTWYDLSNKSNNASLINSPIFTSVNNNGSYFNLNGTNQYMNCGGISNSILSNNQFTISMWLKMSDINNRHDFFGIKNFNSNADDIGFFIHTDNSLGIHNQIAAYFSVNGVVTNNISILAEVSNKSITSNTIYNIDCMKNLSQKIVFYINGVLDSSNYSTTTNTSNVVTNTVVWVGSNRTSPTTPIYDWYGNIYLTKIYNRALTSQEISQNFNALKGRYGL